MTYFSTSRAKIGKDAPLLGTRYSIDTNSDKSRVCATSYVSTTLYLRLWWKVENHQKSVSLIWCFCYFQLIRTPLANWTRFPYQAGVWLMSKSLKPQRRVAIDQGILEKKTFQIGKYVARCALRVATHHSNHWFLVTASSTRMRAKRYWNDAKPQQEKSTGFYSFCCSAWVPVLCF